MADLPLLFSVQHLFMKIDSVDFFYLSMPAVLDIGDGSQDALLVRIRAGGREGWGECEASPLTSIASYEGQTEQKDEIATIKKQDRQSINQTNYDFFEAISKVFAKIIPIWQRFWLIIDNPTHHLQGPAEYDKLSNDWN